MFIYQVGEKPSPQLSFTTWQQQQGALDLAEQNSTKCLHFWPWPIHPNTTSLRQIGYDGRHLSKTLFDSRSALFHLATAINLTDPWTQHYTQHLKFATHDTGTKHINSILMSPQLLQSIEAIRYAPFELFIKSNYCGLFVKLGTTSLFSNTGSKFPPIQLQGVKLNDHQALTTFTKRW